MTWGAYLVRLLAAGGAFAGVVALAYAARGIRGWWIASVLGAVLLALASMATGERGMRLVLYLAVLVLAAVVAAVVVRWRGAGGRRLLVPWALGTVSYAAAWLIGTVLLFGTR